MPAWVWSEQGRHDPLACVSLDRTDDVTPRELLMPTSARGRMAVRKAVSQGLVRLTGEQAVAAAVAALESAQHGLRDSDIAGGQAALASRDGQTTDQPTVIEPEMLDHTTHHDDVPSGPAETGQSQDGEDAWPTLPVWMWLEADEHGTWQANARLNATDGIAAMAVQAPVSPVGLTRLWLPILKTLRELEAGDARSRSVPVWLWTEDHEDGTVAWFSFDRVNGIKSTLLDIPHHERSLTVLREGLGAAMVWLTGCETPDAAARELMKQPLSTQKLPQTRANRKAKSPTKKRAAKTSSSGQRKMVIPRIHVVSGGLSTLGKRR